MVYVPPNAGELTVVEIDGEELNGLISVEGPEINQAKVDTTSIGAAGPKTSRPSKKPEIGPISLQYYFDSSDSVHTDLLAASMDGSTFPYLETYEDGSNYTATVFVASYNTSGNEDEGNVVVDVSLEHTGGVTFTPPVAPFMAASVESVVDPIGNDTAPQSEVSE